MPTSQPIYEYCTLFINKSIFLSTGCCGNMEIPVPPRVPPHPFNTSVSCHNYSIMLKPLRLYCRPLAFVCNCFGASHITLVTQYFGTAQVSHHLRRVHQLSLCASLPIRSTMTFVSSIRFHSKRFPLETEGYLTPIMITLCRRPDCLVSFVYNSILFLTTMCKLVLLLS